MSSVDLRSGKGNRQRRVFRMSSKFNIFVKNAVRRAGGSVSGIIATVCTALFIAVGILDAHQVVQRDSAFAFLGLSYVGVFQRHWFHQVLTAPLMHANVTHLLFNMFSLWMLGPGIERVLGRWRYLVMTILCAASSMIGSLVFNWGTGTITLGYSGVIFGILVAQAIYFPNNVIVIFGFFPFKMKYAVLVMAVVELYLTVSPEQEVVAHSAHLFGVLAALIYLLILRWWIVYRAKQKMAGSPGMERQPRRKAGSDIPDKL